MPRRAAAAPIRKDIARNLEDIGLERFAIVLIGPLGETNEDVLGEVFRLGTVILEVVQEPPEAIERGCGSERPAFFWGLAFIAPDLETTVAGLGESAGETRPAVQPGRRIATLRRSAGLALPVALMTPPPDRGAPSAGTGSVPERR